MGDARVRGGLVAALAFAGVTVYAGGAAGGPGFAGPGTAAGAGSEETYQSAEVCGTCHEAIHAAWAESPHARSAVNPLFREALRAAVDAAPGKDQDAVRRACTWCHAPTTILTGDHQLTRPISLEGTTCDFCHTVADVDLSRAGHPFTLDPGPVKRGPFEYGVIDGHRTAYSPLHRTSPLLCASCHEHRNARGVAVLTSYSDWKAGPYPARGVPCQDCHMALVPGNVARDSAPRGGLRVINLHRVVGGSARSQLARGLDLAIASFARSGGSAQVGVTVGNVAAGHPVPGGLPSRALVLAAAVETADGRLEHRREKVYRRELKDEQGRVITVVADMFLKAAAVGRDNRIKPQESRQERFTLPLPPGARAVVVRLEYRDTSDPRGAPLTTLITEIRRELAGP
jgi:hypothetical protein